MTDEVIDKNSLTITDIGLAYRLFLLRRPENDDVRREKVGLTYQQLALLFIGSEEFRRRVVEMAPRADWQEGRARAPLRLIQWTEAFAGVSLAPDASRATLLWAALAAPRIAGLLEQQQLEWSPDALREDLARLARVPESMPTAEYLNAGLTGIRAGLDGVDRGILEGWILGASPRTTHVDIYLDGEKVARVLATRRRMDIPRLGSEAPPRGFALPLPGELFDDAGHRIMVAVDNTPIIAADLVLRIEDDDPDPVRSQAALDMSGLFDAEHYAHQLGYMPADPLDHYRTSGWRLGLDPHPLFLTEFYRAQRPETMRFDPLFDFYVLGQHERVSTHPLLDFQLYTHCRPDAVERRIHPTIHYIAEAWLDPHLDLKLFDTSYYLSQAPMLIEQGWRPLIHYLRLGWTDKRKPHREFDPELFARLAGLAEGVEPLTYFAQQAVVAGYLSMETIDPASKPDVSILILNLNKWLMTAQCVFFLRRQTRGVRMQIIVIDNGSDAEIFRSLCDWVHNVQIIRSDRNLGFGEANNFASESATAPLLMLLNNDVYVGENWFAPLRELLLSNDEIAAVGPKMRYGDGRLQEAGGMISADGGVIQYGKGLDAEDVMFNYRKKVDYISAAALLLRPETFDAVLGFDLCWDPAYYEDVDLCLKLALTGGEIWYEPRSVVTHLENATSSDVGLDLGLHNIIAVNRLKFVRRWGDYLSGRSRGYERELLPQSTRPVAAMAAAGTRIALFTPYPLTPGGGERYLLSIAHELRDLADFTLFTLHPTSRIRIRTLGRELGLDLENVRLAIWDRSYGNLDFDIFISIGNEALPMAPAIGRRNFYICQFPFPMQAGHYARDWGHDRGL